MATCPECDFDEIETEDYDEGDAVSCPECGSSLIVMGGDELEAAADDDDLDDEDDLDDDDEDADDEEDADEDEDVEEFDE